MSKLFFSLGIILAGLSLGYIIQRLENLGVLRMPIALPILRKRLQQIGLLFFMSISFLGAIWVVEVGDARIMTLPLVGVVVLLSGGFLALGVARWMQLPPRQTGAYYACGSFSNIGSIGSLVTFFFLGEAGFALVPLYKLCEEIVYYAIGFPIAKLYSNRDEKALSIGGRLKPVFTDPFVLTALAAITIGGILNICDVPRPALFGTVTALFVPVGTFILLTSIGLAMRFSSTAAYIRPCLALSGIKFLALPTLAVTMASMLGLGTIMDGLPLKVVLILSSMPVAFAALIPPSIYDLDIDLANACWLTTTLALVIVVPVLYVIVL